MDVKNNTQHGILYLEFPTEHCLKQKTIKRLNYFSCDLLFLCIYNEIKLKEKTLIMLLISNKVNILSNKDK